MGERLKGSASYLKAIWTSPYLMTEGSGFFSLFLGLMNLTVDGPATADRAAQRQIAGLHIGLQIHT